MRVMCASLFLLLAVSPVHADFRAYQRIPVDRQLDAGIERIAGEILEEYGDEGLKDGHLSISIVDISDSRRPRRAGYREEVAYHPASTVKVLFLATVYDQLSRGEIEMNEELTRAVRDMIVGSGNDATSYVVDRISGTTSGPELYGSEFAEFQQKRDVTNRLFRSMGYDLNANGKTWCENVYGREKQLLGRNREYRNRLTSAGAASLMYSLATNRLVSPAASIAMLAWMRREVPPSDGETQVRTFLGESVPPGSALWSKAGWTGEVRHDMTVFELPSGKRYVVAVFTRGAAQDETLLPAIGARIVELIEPQTVRETPSR